VFIEGGGKMPLKKKKRKISLKKKVVKRKVTKKRLKKRPARKKAVVKKVKENIIGTVTHYFPKVRAGVIKLKKSLSTGDTIKIKGHTTDFTQNVNSMQIDHVPINSAKKGQEIGLLVNSRVRQHDIVYKV
jgi:hypothetical protein